MFEYQAKILAVIDDDTIDAEVDLGFHTFTKVRFRFARINTPELKSSIAEERAMAIKAKDRVVELTAGKKVILKTKKTDLYGRWLAEVLVEEKNVNDILLSEGLAKLY